jgi:general secretion pathway protein F
MTIFQFKAKGSDGRTVRGEIEAEGRSKAIDALIARRVTPLDLRELAAERTPKISYQDAARLSAEVARLTAAGVPLEAGAALAAEAQETKAARSALKRAAARLADGRGPGAAFAGLEGTPGRALSAIVAAGERSGRLADALQSASPLFSATAKFRERIVSLLLYPAAVSIAALGAVIIFLLVVIPSLKPVLLDLDAEMSTSTRLLLAASDAAPGLLIGTLLIVLLMILLSQIPKLRLAMAHVRDRLALGPLGMGMASAIDTAMFARLFAALLKAGTPAGDALAEAASAVANTILRARLMSAAGSLREGAALDAALCEGLGERHLIVQASRLGARGGNFADLVAEAGLTLAERAEVRLERFAALAAPLVIIVLGVVIGTLVITLFSSLSALPDAATR